MKEDIFEQHVSYRKQIYIDIDSLLDTRLGILTEYFPQVAGNILFNLDKYYNRLRDDFYPIGNTTFKYFYSKRNKDTLKLSKLTNIMEVIIEEIGFVEFNLEIKNLVNKAEVVLNLFPYEFTEKEKEKLELIIYNLVKHIPFDLKIINKNPLELDKTELEKYYAIIMYSGMEWLKYKIATREITNGEILEARLYIPLQLDIINLQPNKIEESINYLTKTMRYFTDLRITENRYFSIKK